MLADQMLGAEMHEPGIDGTMFPRRSAGEKSGARAPVDDDVAVAPPQRREPGVEIAADRSGPQYRHVRRQIRIGAAHPGMIRAGRGSIEVHDLRRGVNARVGASRRRPPEPASPRSGSALPRPLPVPCVEPAGVRSR